MSRVVEAQVKDSARIRARHQAIAEAGTRIFKENGFHNASIRDVEIAAGLTQGSLYNYIRSKDDVLYLVCAEVTSRYTEQVMAAIEGIENPAARLRAAIEALVRCMHANRDGIRLVYQESHALEPDSLKAVQAQMSQFIDFFEDIFEQAKDQKLAVSTSMLAADIVTFIPTLLALRGWHLHRHAQTEAVIKEVTAFLLRGLGLEASADDEPVLPVMLQVARAPAPASAAPKRAARKPAKAKE
jgi:AcrR family transcriptional regulator